MFLSRTGSHEGALQLRMMLGASTLRLLALALLFALSLGNADPRGLGAPVRPPGAPLARRSEGDAMTIPSQSKPAAVCADGQGGSALAHGSGALVAPNASHPLASEWHDMCVQLNRAMAQLQSNAPRRSAKEASRDLNRWLMHLLSQPQPDEHANEPLSYERRALLTNLKRISQLQKDNLRLRLQHIANNPSSMRSLARARGGDEALQLRRTVSPGPAYSELPPGPKRTALENSESINRERERASLDAAAELLRHPQPPPAVQRPAPAPRLPQSRARGTELATRALQAPRGLPPARQMGGRQPLDEYAFHRRGQGRGRGTSRPGPLGTASQVRTGEVAVQGQAGGWREGGGLETRGEMVGLSERPLVGQEEARSEAGRGAPACAGAPEREGGMEGGAEQRQAWLLRELQGVNRQLSHEVSTLANENLRLKSAATTADMSLLEAAVAQLSSRDVAAERAVPDIVKAALQWDQHIAGKSVSAPRPGCTAGGGLEEGAGPAERGRVMASAALLKRLRLQIGQHVRLKRDMSRDRLGTKVHVSGGAFLGVLVGETQTGGRDDATVYLHMDDGQVRQFGLSEIETGDAADGGLAVGGALALPVEDDVMGGGRAGEGMRGREPLADLAMAAMKAAQERERVESLQQEQHSAPASHLHSTSTASPHLSSYCSSRADDESGGSGGGGAGGGGGRGQRRRALLSLSRQMMSQDLKV